LEEIGKEGGLMKFSKCFVLSAFFSKLPLFPIAPSVADNFRKYVEEFRTIFQPAE
jgi:hypothetical protein